MFEAFTSGRDTLPRVQGFIVGVLLLLTLSARAAEELPLKPPKNGGIYVIAHRGAHDGIPENTLAAYEKAIELGCDFVEVDIRTTKDGEFVSVHNRSIDAYVNGATGEVRDMTLAELKALDIGAKHGDKWIGTRIPTFEEILDLVKGRCGIYLDLKDGAIDAVAAMIIEKNMEHDVVWCISPSEITPLRKACPACIEMPDPGNESNLPAVIRRYRPRMMAPVWRDFSDTYAETCHRAGITVFVDEDNESSWPDALAWGADGIQTDDPAGLIAFLTKIPPH